MIRRTVNYQCDGLDMQGELFEPDRQGPRPGVLVFPEAFGLGEHACAKAAQIADLGYFALACDLHGDAKLVPSLEEVGAAIAPLWQDRAKTRSRATGAMEALSAQAGVDRSAIAAIGFCFGGAMAIELGCNGADLKAIVAFHSNLATIDPQALENINGRMLLCLGADDPGVTPDQRVAFQQALDTAGVRWDMHVYGGVVHSFTNPAADSLGSDSMRYDQRADRLSFQAMAQLFEEVLPG